MNLNKISSALVVAGLFTVATSASWGANTPAVPTPTAAPVTTALPNQANPNPTGTALSPIGGNGGPSGTPTAAQVTAGFGTGILGTPHDFASGAGTTNPATGAAAVGLCTYCHTPHKASSTLLLWNHTLSNNAFAWDVAATTAGTALPGFSGNAYKGPSAKCLSCHDGSVAIGDIGWFSQTAQSGAPVNTFKIGTDTSTANAGNPTDFQVGANGNLSGTHPVAIPYPLNGAPNVYNGSTTGARLATNDFVADPTANNMRLYSDVGGGTIVGKVQAGVSGIECSTCHDPHNKASKGDYFLRGSLAGSAQSDGYICLQCHIK